MQTVVTMLYAGEIVVGVRLYLPCRRTETETDTEKLRYRLSERQKEAE